MSDLQDLIESVRELLHLLQDIQLNSWAVTGPVSTFEPLMEAAIEALWLLAKEVSIGSPRLNRNKELRFSEKAVDSLGNPKQISFRKEFPPVWSEELGNFLSDVVIYLLEVQKHWTEGISFHEKFNRHMLPEIPKNFGPEEAEFNPLQQIEQPSHPRVKNQFSQRERKRHNAHFYLLRRRRNKPRFKS